MYFFDVTVFFFFLEEYDLSDTLTAEWDGHFLFNEEKKVRVFNGVFPFYFVFNPS